MSLKNMLGAVLDRLSRLVMYYDESILGVIIDLLDKLMNIGREVWLLEFKKFLRKEPCWEPKFLLQGDQEIQFRWVAKQVVFHTLGVFNNETLGNLLRCAPCTRDFWRGDKSLSLVPYFVGLLLARGIIRVHGLDYVVVMTQQEYEIDYGVRSSE